LHIIIIIIITKHLYHAPYNKSLRGEVKTVD
jgi:hypothetical protein